MNTAERKKIIAQAKIFFSEIIVKKHIARTKMAGKLKNYTSNPFLTSYLANFLEGDDRPASLAKALLYPRALGTSITTSFGINFQIFCANSLRSFGSTTPGMDIEFIDQIDGRKKYCQLKSGPQTINSPDVKTIIDHFNSAKRLARANSLKVGLEDFIVGVFYGTSTELNANYKAIEKDFPVFVGVDFWHRLTGSKKFYSELLEAIGEVANEFDGSKILAETVSALAKDIEKSDI